MKRDDFLCLCVLLILPLAGILGFFKKDAPVFGREIFGKITEIQIRPELNGGILFAGVEIENEGNPLLSINCVIAASEGAKVGDRVRIFTLGTASYVTAAGSKGEIWYYHIAQKVATESLETESWKFPFLP